MVAVSNEFASMCPSCFNAAVSCRITAATKVPPDKVTDRYVYHGPFTQLYVTWLAAWRYTVCYYNIIAFPFNFVRGISPVRQIRYHQAWCSASHMQLTITWRHRGRRVDKTLTSRQFYSSVVTFNVYDDVHLFIAMSWWFFFLSYCNE